MGDLGLVGEFEWGDRDGSVESGGKSGGGGVVGGGDGAATLVGAGQDPGFYGLVDGDGGCGDGVTGGVVDA